MVHLRFIKYRGGGGGGVGVIFLNAFFCGLHLNFQDRKRDIQFLPVRVRSMEFSGIRDPLNAFFAADASKNTFPGKLSAAG